MSDVSERVSAYIASLGDDDRRALGRLFGALYDEREAPTPGLCAAIRAIGALDDVAIAGLAAWFQTHVNMWGVIVGDAASRERLRFSQRRTTTYGQGSRAESRLGIFRKPDKRLSS